MSKSARDCRHVIRREVPAGDRKPAQGDGKQVEDRARQSPSRSAVVPRKPAREQWHQCADEGAVEETEDDRRNRRRRDERVEFAARSVEFRVDDFAGEAENARSERGACDDRSGRKTTAGGRPRLRERPQTCGDREPRLGRNGRCDSFDDRMIRRNDLAPAMLGAYVFPPLFAEG